MGNEIVNYTMGDMEKLAISIAKSKLFGIKTPEEALSLMAIAQAEGLHPAIAARDYHVIQGRPSLKADAMLSRFQASGGRVEWHTYTDECCDATLTHPQGGTVRIMWDMARVKKAEISNSAMYKKYPRNMLRARVISEGIRTIYPGVCVGVYTPEEVDAFEKPKSAMEQWADTPPAITLEQKPEDTTFIETWSRLFAKRIDDAGAEKEIDEMVASSTAELKELYEKKPDWFERLSEKINIAKEACRLAEPIAAE